MLASDPPVCGSRESAVDPGGQHSALPPRGWVPTRLSLGASTQGCRPVLWPHSPCYSCRIILHFQEGTQPNFVLQESLGRLPLCINIRCLWLGSGQE